MLMHPKSETVASSPPADKQLSYQWQLNSFPQPTRLRSKPTNKYLTYEESKEANKSYFEDYPDYLSDSDLAALESYQQQTHL